jgi:polar amino acid transport system permease protein
MPDLLERYGLQLLEGLAVTLELVAISIVLGALIAIPITAARLSKNRLIAGAAYGYVYFFRGTPLLAQLFLIYYGAGQFSGTLKAIGLWGFFRDAFNCAVFAFAINTAAYQAEIYRGAIRSVARGQWEAAQSLGVGRMVTLWKVILPQAAMVALRPIGNEIILMIKASAVASIVTVFDLMGQTKLAFSRSYDLTIYLYAAVLYLIMVEAIRRVWNVLERRLTRHLRRDAVGQPAPKAADLVPATH